MDHFEMPENWNNYKLQCWRTDAERKKRHYFITAPPNWGKTYPFARIYSKHCYFWNYTEEFQDYAGQQLIVLDEFRAGYSVPFGVLTQLCDGTYPIPRKNRPAIGCVDTTIVVISNQTCFEDVYKNLCCKPLAVRFNHVDMEARRWSPYLTEEESDV